ncbi:Short transient receptor potential channel 4 [Acropora cervicornis]|uniref:Short transient receptor potential channel 4 n=1 Tax=Acropora cervicornis TaxID=6130 RepID=A0AAD9VGM4_ACRCE|nr:Short transient receptor potential channel 4 [Acropora cervicornis]
MMIKMKPKRRKEKASSELRVRADEKGPDEEEFTKLANFVDEFSYSLLNPLKLDVELRHLFADSLADTLTHPVLYRLMSNRWFGEFRTLKRSSLLSLQYLKWCLLNIWCVFDVLFFPLLLFLFYIIHICRDKARKKEVAQEAFRAMKVSVKYIIREYGNDRAKYHIIIRHPDDCSFQSHKICFNTPHVDVTALTDAVEELQTEGNKYVPALHKDLQKATEAFESNVLIILTDHRPCFRIDTEERQNQMEQARKQLNELKDRKVKVITAAFGPYVNLRQLMDVNGEADVLHFQVEEKESFKFFGKDLLHNSYRDYFTTPYFVFIRDALSYLVLLGLHFTICLEVSSISYTWIEWAILVVYYSNANNFQITKVRRQERTKHDIADVDRWNILDLITIILYFATFVLRMVTLVVSESVTDNRSLVIAGYFYGVNTMFLTLRAFGHVMETTKQIGTIQIALFHILTDLVTIFWQFMATILAFSIAITKVYVAEKSFISEDNGKEFWWKMVEHLCWSLMGDVEVDPLESADDPSVMLVHFLYGAFLVMGVILLINMMIALLSNTYQNVQV